MVDSHHLDKRAGALLDAIKDPAKDDFLLNSKTVAAMLGCSLNWLETGRGRGWGPRFVRYGRSVKYPRSELRKWLEERLEAPRQRKPERKKIKRRIMIPK